MGEWNQKVVRGAGGSVAGSFGFGEINERGNNCAEWCEAWD